MGKVNVFYMVNCCICWRHQPPLRVLPPSIWGLWLCITVLGTALGVMYVNGSLQAVEKKYMTEILCNLKAWAKKKDLREDIKVHADILQRSFLAKNTHLGSSLVWMYAKCGKKHIKCCYHFLTKIRLHEML